MVTSAESTSGFCNLDTSGTKSVIGFCTISTEHLSSEEEKDLVHHLRGATGSKSLPVSFNFPSAHRSTNTLVTLIEEEAKLAQKVVNELQQRGLLYDYEKLETN